MCSKPTQESFAAIEPPAIAEDYHALLLETFGMLGQMFDTMATAGIFGALIYVEQLDALEIRSNEAAGASKMPAGSRSTEPRRGRCRGDSGRPTTVEVTDESGDSTANAGIRNPREPDSSRANRKNPSGLGDDRDFGHARCGRSDRG